MLGQTFYHQTIRKYVALFGTLFNDISIEKKDSNNNVVSKIKVPVAYGPKQKFLARLEADPNLDKQISIKLPRIGFEMTAINYDPERKLNSIGKMVNKSYVSNSRTLKTMYNPNPYTFDFSLFVFVDNAEDGTQILEQILPYFTPEFTVSVNILTDMGLKLDVPIVLNSSSVEDDYLGDFLQRRAIVWTLDFTLKGFIYPNIRTSDKIIKSIDISFRTPIDQVNLNNSELVFLNLENSNNFSINRLLLEDETHLLFENSDSNIGSKNIISKISITPISETADKTENLKSITIFNPSAYYNNLTGEYET